MSAALLDYDSEEAPFGKVKVSRPRVETYAYVPPMSLPAPARKPLPVFSFTTAEGQVQRLTTPLMVHVAIEDGEVFVENEALSIFGHGPTLQAAMDLFSRDLAYFWQYYRSLGNDDVAGEGATLKRIYEELVS